ncbi:MAG TPA: branched-chain amino acid ABC transporter permease [Gaiellaceae bacterium]|jgi:branched-chain amino acid transport system permease protein|nr:branched-chain amino acid ABC transporter permease [Gaiellaceae bacterium]
MTQFVQALILGLMIGGVYALLASGLTLIFGVMDVINVAQGALIILSAFITWALWKEMGIDPLLGALITTPAMFVIGWVIYRLTIQWISGRPASTSVLLTFALALVLEGIMGLVWSTTYHSSTPGYVDESFRAGGFYFPKAQLFGCAMAIGVLAALYMMLTRTWLGRAIRAVSENVSSARLVGVNARKVAALTFAIGVATTGAGGSITSVLYPFLPGSHYQWISRLLGIIVLGGMGSLPGALVGALVLGVAETMTVTYISPRWATMVPYAVIMVVLLARPQGIMGAKLREDVVV